jgi:hypothetical protein
MENYSTSKQVRKLASQFSRCTTGVVDTGGK